MLWKQVLIVSSLLFHHLLSAKNSIAQEAANRNSSTSRRHLVVVTLEAAPFMMKSFDQNNSVQWHGYCMDFFRELIKHLPYDQVTYEIYQVEDNKFGSKSKILNPNKQESGADLKQNQKQIESWNGLIGDLYYGKAHLALAPLAVMAERELVIDFTVPFYDLVGIQILLKKPEVPQDWFKFLTVLDNEVWFSITIAYFVTSFVMFLFDRLSPYSHKNMSRIERLRANRKRVLSIEKPISSNIEPNPGSINSIVGGANNFSHGNPLSKGHQLFIGSMGYPLRETRRRSSAFIRDGFDALFGVKRRDSICPSSEVNKTNNEQLQQQRHSTTFSDYIKGINLRTSFTTNKHAAAGESGWEGEEADQSGSDAPSEDGKPDFGLRDSLWFCITSLTPQGGGEAPQNLSGRVVAGAWWLFCFIIIASYTANLAAFLTVSRLDIPIESLDDLAKQYRIKYAPVDGTAEQTYFERMAYIEEIFYNIWKDMSLNDSLSEEDRSKFAVWDYPISDKYTKIWAQIQQVGMPTSTEEAIRRVKSSTLDDGFALLADANMVKHAVMTDCHFKAVGDEFSRKPIALGLRKGDDKFRDHLSYAILQLINQRYMEILREKWWTNNPSRVVCDNNDESEGISVANIGGVFIIIFAGVVLSFLVWALERFVYRTKVSVSQDFIQRL